MADQCKVDTKERRDNLAFLENSDKPTLENLSYALRHPETWPEGFFWDYSYCGQCAMGLARALWGEHIKYSEEGEHANEMAASATARAFAMPYAVTANIFLGKGDWVPVREKTKTTGSLWWKTTERRLQADHSSITPEMVADQIEKYIAKNK